MNNPNTQTPSLDLSRQIRWAALSALVGLLALLVASFAWTPATFVGAAAIGLPGVMLSAAIVGRAAWIARRTPKAPGTRESRP